MTGDGNSWPLLANHCCCRWLTCLHYKTACTLYWCLRHWYWYHPSLISKPSPYIFPETCCFCAACWFHPMYSFDLGPVLRFMWYNGQPYIRHGITIPAILRTIFHNQLYSFLTFRAVQHVVFTRCTALTWGLFSASCMMASNLVMPWTCC